MKRRSLLALLPLPWLAKWLSGEPRIPDSAWHGFDSWVKAQPTKQVGATTFVCRKPEGVLLLRQNMKIDFYEAPPWWRRLWNRLCPPEPPATGSTSRITSIDYDTKTVTFGPGEPDV